ncbi:MAG: gamma carbonic anhydrase family protein [Pontibacterium sp.]
MSQSKKKPVQGLEFNGEGHFIAESAVIDGNVSLSSHVSIWFNATVSGLDETVSVGKGNQIESGATLEAVQGHSLRLNDYVMVGENAHLMGCHVGEGCLIGRECVIAPGAVVGKYSMIAAQSHIPADMVIPDYALVMGQPAVVEEVLTQAQIKTVEQDVLQAQDVMMGLFKSLGKHS